MGVAKVLSENKDKIKGNVKLIFQPAEEGPGGAKPMIDDGALENPKVDAIMGLHVGSLTEAKKEGKPASRYTSMKNKHNTPERIELKKYNPFLRRHTIHKEIK